MITLERPREDLAPSYFEFIEEMRQHGDKIWAGYLPKENETVSEFVQRLILGETKPLPGLVAETIYWGCEGKLVVGRIGFRHALNDNLKEFGGNIGYEVRPSCRNRGIAKEMLKLVLQTPKAKEVGKFLLTCAPDNVASNKTIVSNGGVLEKTTFVEKWQRNTNYYWINLK